MLATVRGLPTWLLVLVAVVAAGLLIWRFVALMSTRFQVLQFAAVPVLLAVIMAVVIPVKHISANYALVLYSDLVLAFTIGTLPVGRSIREFAKEYAGSPLPRDMPGKTPGIWISVFFVALVVLLAAEYFTWR